MPPSPARFSPGRELKADSHKRGRSLESGMQFVEKDDDLALFNEVQNKERDNFLLQSNDDFDDLFATRLRYFSDCKLAVSVPARGESSDLLNTDGDKNDYDWLITPPDTPLFTSLDDETPQVNLVSRGRPRSQPKSISRSSTMEKSYQSSRGSASPNRLSPSPGPAYSTYQSRGRPSSASHASPPLTLATPSRRSSPSPNKCASPSLSPPPTFRNTAPSRRPSPPPNKSATPTPRRKSTDSPIKTSRGNSMSPKIKAWQSNIPGFSLEVPPNLRTSLADRPSSNMRGSSPASRNGFKSGRQSTSPSSSSQSHERDLFSSRGRGSMASSGDDDVDSILSTSTAPKSISSSLNDKALGYSKRPNRIVSQRSSDMSLRRMDQQKTPHNMFRPLLSSVPTSTFYSGKASAAHRAILSRNSSITTSSNTSTDHCTSEQNPEDVSSMYTETPISTIQDSLRAYNDDDAVEEKEKGKLEGNVAINLESVAMNSATGEIDLADAVDVQESVVCSKCGCSFVAVNLTGDLKLCPKCKSSEVFPVNTAPLKSKDVGNFSPGISANLTEYDFSDTSTPSFPLSESPKRKDTEANINMLSEGYIADRLIEKRLLDLPEMGESCVSNEISGCDISSRQDLGVVEVPEAAGIPLVFRRSHSCVGDIVQNRGSVSSDLPSDDLAYVRGTAYRLSSSVGHGSMSTSSSTDLSSAKHVESRIQRQRSASYFSGLHFLTSTTNSCEEVSDLAVVHVEKNTLEEKCGGPQESAEVFEAHLAEDVEEGGACNESDCGTASEHLSNNTITHFEGTSFAPVSNCEEFSSLVDGENTALLSNEDLDRQEPFADMPSSMSNLCVDCVQVQDEICLDTVSEIGAESGVLDSSEPESVVSSPNLRSKEDEMQEPAINVASENITAASVDESESIGDAHGILEESTVLLESQGRLKARSLTLDEATDTILFCSSIVQNLAYEAANTAIEKENSALFQSSRPTVTIVGKANTDRIPCNKTVTKRAPKLKKPKKAVERDQIPPPSKTESEESMEEVSTTRIVGAPSKTDSLRPQNLESKCNCTIM